VSATIVLAVACTKPEPTTRQRFDDYLAASNAHDLATLELMTSNDIVWLLGPWVFSGKEEALRPQYADLVNHTSLKEHDVTVRGDTVECILVERNDATGAHGPDSLIHYVRYVFHDGLLVKKEPSAPSPSLAELNRRAQPFRAWVRDEHPEALSVILDSNGSPQWTREAVDLVHLLRHEWVEAGKPGSEAADSLDAVSSLLSHLGEQA
jgi:ketosteroid isomerase-like protein